jgi:hypothetical protein
VGAKPPTYDELAARFIGKQGIYFARRQLPPAGETGAAGGARAALPMLLSLVNTPARRGPPPRLRCDRLRNCSAHHRRCGTSSTS